jgi:hypothetical protein
MRRRNAPTRSFTHSLIAVCVLSACTSGPAPVDDRPYEQQVLNDRAEKDAAFRTARNSPLLDADRPGFAGLPYYPVDPAFRVPAFLHEDRSGPPVIIELSTSIDGREKMRKVGALGFTLGQASYRLTAFASVKAETVDRLFVPFGDLTSGTETYKGGRYLDLDRTPTGLYDLDFNRAYHPYCVYNPSYECPLPPRENRLAVAIHAGERLRH